MGNEGSRQKFNNQTDKPVGESSTNVQIGDYSCTCKCDNCQYVAGDHVHKTNASASAIKSTDPRLVEKMTPIPASQFASSVFTPKI